MEPGANERLLEILEDLDARLAGLEVGYSDENARAAEELVDELDRHLEADPEPLVALRAALEELTEAEDSKMVAPAKEHADELKRQIEAESGVE